MKTALNQKKRGKHPSPPPLLAVATSKASTNVRIPDRVKSPRRENTDWQKGEYLSLAGRKGDSSHHVAEIAFFVYLTKKIFTPPRGRNGHNSELKNGRKKACLTILPGTSTERHYGPMQRAVETKKRLREKGKRWQSGA